MLPMVVELLMVSPLTLLVGLMLVVRVDGGGGDGFRLRSV